MPPHSSDKHLLVVARHPLVRLGICQFIQELQLGYRCELTTTSLQQLPASLLQTPGMGLIIELGETQEEQQSSIQQLLLLCERHPQLNIVAYSLHWQATHLAELQQHNTIRLISPRGSLEQMRKEMVMALAGGNVCNSVIPQPNKNIGSDMGKLTRCERNVLNHLLAGLSPTEIAALCHRSIKTISAHKCNGMRKLGVNSDAELFQLSSANTLPDGTLRHASFVR